MCLQVLPHIESLIHSFLTNTAPRVHIPQLTSLIFYSCKSKLDCWSLFCSLLSSNGEGGSTWSCPMTGCHSSVVNSSPEMKQQTTCQHKQAGWCLLHNKGTWSGVIGLLMILWSSFGISGVKMIVHQSQLSPLPIFSFSFSEQ